MRNSYRTKMIAWIIAAVILLCAVPMTSMADIAPLDEYEDEFVVNRYASCTAVFTDEAGKQYDNLTGAGQGKTYTLHLTVNENKPVADLIETGDMIYMLPDRVGNIISIDGTNVNGVQSQNAIRFTWTNGKQTGFSAEIKFTTAANVYDLYNIAKIGGTYYRLAKTTIKTDKELSKNFGKYLDEKDYTIQAYDFTDLKITVNNKEYVYYCDKNMDEIARSGKYYTAKFDNINVLSKKIGALDGSGKPRWLVPENQRYNDSNYTDSFHGNYTIVLHEEPYEQDLYNMLHVGNDYYRLRKSRVVARDPKDYRNAAVLKEGDYTIVSNDDYNFSNVVLNIRGETYRYSDHELTEEEMEGGFVSYFTVSFENVVRQERINGSADWYANKAGWLDGAEAEYGAEGNDVLAYHRNYTATLHKGTIQRSIRVYSDWPAGKIAYPGAEITLHGEITGFDENCSLQWEHSTDTVNWVEEEGATQLDYSYTLDEENATYYWRLVVNDGK